MISSGWLKLVRLKPVGGFRVNIPVTDRRPTDRGVFCPELCVFCVDWKKRRLKNIAPLLGYVVVLSRSFEISAPNPRANPHHWVAN